MIVALSLVAVALLSLSALLSGAETATFSVGASRLRTLRDEGFQNADALSRLRGRPGPVRGTLILLDTLANVCLTGLLVAMGADTWGRAGAGAGLGVAAVAILFFGELLPRAVALRQPIRVALAAAPILLRVARWVRPLLAPVSRFEGFLSDRDGDGRASLEEREVLEMSQLGQEEGVVGLEEHLLVERAFRLDELSAWDVMTPRVDVFAWKDSRTLEEIIGELKKVPYSRVPVFGESVDDVTGILYVREAYETYVAGRKDTPLHQISREPFFVPGSLSLTQLLRDFQARRIHMGIVADEFGGTDGLVTLEDVLEELVGEIVDETDVDEEPLIRISRTQIVADGGIDLREINHAMNVSLPQLEHRSLNGFILEELGYVPDRGESLERAGVRIDVLEATDTQVLRARVTRLQAAGGGEAA